MAEGPYRTHTDWTRHLSPSLSAPLTTPNMTSQGSNSHVPEHRH